MVGAIKAYNNAVSLLLAAGIDARVEPRTLFEAATGLRREDLAPSDEISDGEADALVEFVMRRILGEPLQYLAGRWPFLDFELSVGRGALIPRPETELLAETAITFLKTRGDPAALDLCSGTGCVAIALKRALPRCDVAALERSPEALEYLKANAAALAAGVRVISGDAFGYERSLAPASLDCITCNPPYLTPAEYDGARELAHEPREAFVGGADGLDFYRYIIPNYKAALKSGGELIFETGFSQTDAVIALMREAGYSGARALDDIFGNPRVVVGSA